MNLDKVRQEIDLVDTQMKELFLTRMGLSAQVIAAKKQSQAAVYVPDREAEIIKKHLEGVEAEQTAEYRMFLKQVMGISRTYQYSKIAKESAEFIKIPKGEGAVSMRIFEKNGEMRIAAMLDALVLAGLSIDKLSQEEKSADGTFYQMTVCGDFSKELAKGAILQICREMEQAEFL